MDYIMEIRLVIDTESNKNTIRDFLSDSIEQQISSGNLKTGTMNINGVLIPSEDNETYSWGD